jgi:hypothetical protein
MGNIPESDPYDDGSCFPCPMPDCDGDVLVNAETDVFECNKCYFSFKRPDKP